MQQYRLIAILAHPDDESLGTGGTLARYAAEGVHVSLVTATRGERGWFGDSAEYPGPTALGRIREAELYAAADALGVRDVALLEYLDGELDRVDPTDAISHLAYHLRRVRPHVVITFDPNGLYGHPDHIAISQFTTAAVVAAASPTYTGRSGMAALPPHQISKLYYRVETRANLAAYEAAFGDLVMYIDGVERRTVGWEPWAITTRIDTAGYWQQVWRAVSCHQSQLPGYEALSKLPAEHHQNLWGSQSYYRTFSLVNGGRAREDDLFAGLPRTTPASTRRQP